MSSFLRALLLSAVRLRWNYFDIAGSVRRTSFCSHHCSVVSLELACRREFWPSVSVVAPPSKVLHAFVFLSFCVV